MINPQKPVINLIKNCNRFTALIYIYVYIYIYMYIYVYIVYQGGRSRSSGGPLRSPLDRAGLFRLQLESLET